MLPAAACSGRSTRFEIVDYADPVQPRRYSEGFEEAYYAKGEDGHIDIVLRRSTPGRADGTPPLTQVIYLRTIWQSVPGVNGFNRTQINGMVSYFLASGDRGTLYEGAGSLYLRENRRKNRLRGSLGLAVLQPKRRLTTGSDVFQQAELSGVFRAKHNARQVARIMNDMNRKFTSPTLSLKPGDVLGQSTR